MTLNIQEVPVTKIKPAVYNPRKDLRPGDPAYDRLKKALSEFDLVEPLVWNERTGNLVGGHQRFKILLERGDQTVPVSIVDLDDEREKLLNVALNKHSGEWDLPMLAQVLQSLKASAQDLELTGFDPSELKKIAAWIPPTTGLTDENAVPETPLVPTTVPGDLWLLGSHRLLCGDSTTAEDVARLMSGEKAALMATDPPYMVNYQGGNHPQSWANKPDVKDKHWDDYHDPDAASGFFKQFLTVALAHLEEHAAIYQWHASSRQALVQSAWEQTGLHLHQTIVWIKTRPVLTRCHYMWQFEPAFYGWLKGKSPHQKPPANSRNVWEIDQQGEQDGIHPTQKPAEIFRRPLLYHTQPGGLALEPFSGSGTAIIAAEGTGRRVYAMELSPQFVDVAIVRWQAFTGQIATLESTGSSFAETAHDRGTAPEET
jgi:DNA modification methylase